MIEFSGTEAFMGEITSGMWMAIGLACSMCLLAIIVGFYLNELVYGRLGVMMLTSLTLLVAVRSLPLPLSLENVLSLVIFIGWFLVMSIFGSEPDNNIKTA